VTDAGVKVSDGIAKMLHDGQLEYVANVLNGSVEHWKGLDQESPEKYLNANARMKSDSIQAGRI